MRTNGMSFVYAAAGLPPWMDASLLVITALGLFLLMTKGL